MTMKRAKRLIIPPTAPAYAPVTLSKKRSNAWIGFGLCMPSFRISAHSAGVSVSAVIADSSVEIVMVMANCLYSVPVTPPRNAIGTNTAQITAVTPMMALPMPFIASREASRGPRPLSCMIFSTASTTTIASSTTMPIASTSPNSVSMLIEKPISSMPAAVPTSDTGIASSGMMVARTLPRNR